MIEDGLLISGGGLSARISPVGATLRDLRLDADGRPLLMAFNDPAKHQSGPTYANTVVGRVANRLAGGRASVNGTPLQLETNVGSYHLHGGRVGFSHRNWTVSDHREDSLSLQLHSANGDQGYPGALDVRATFALRNASTLALTIEGTCSAPTLVNLTHHLYFNLGGFTDILNHRLWLASDRYLDADADLVPTGVVKQVDEDALDFRSTRDMAVGAGTRNHTFVLGRSVEEKLRHAATLDGPDGIRMDLWTNQPALHVYDGYKIPAGDALTSGHCAQPHSGMCLEPQNWTDAPNHLNFPSIELRPDERYVWRTEYRFAERS